jgi:hypothetical protein
MVSKREVLNTRWSLSRSGCQGDMRPNQVQPTSRVDDDCAPWLDDGTWAWLVKALRPRHRGEVGRESTSGAACIARKAVKTTERKGPERGYDGGKPNNGRTRPLWGISLGRRLAIVTTSAGLDAFVAALQGLGNGNPQDFPHLVTIVADQKPHPHHLAVWMVEPSAGGHLALKTRPTGPRGCITPEQRRVLARTNAWHWWYRRTRNDAMRRSASSTAMLQMSHLPLLLRRLGPCGYPTLHDRKEAA